MQGQQTLKKLRVGQKLEGIKDALHIEPADGIVFAVNSKPSACGI